MNIVIQDIKSALVGKTIRTAYYRVVVSEDIESIYDIILDTCSSLFSISCSSDGFLKIDVIGDFDRQISITPTLQIKTRKCHASDQEIINIELMKAGGEFIGVKCYLRELELSVYNGGDDLKITRGSLQFIGEEAVEYISIG